MKKVLFYLIASSFAFSLSCAKKESAFESWKSKYTVSNPLDDLTFPENPKAKETAKDKTPDEGKDKTDGQPGETGKPKKDEMLIRLDKIPDKPIIKIVTVTANSTSLQKGPGLKFEKMGTANKDDRFTLLRTVPGIDKEETWHQVQNSKGEKFFVSSADTTVSNRKEKISRNEKATIEKIQTIFDPTPPLPKELLDAKVITLNFEQTDINDVITTFCDLLKLDYLIEGAVQGKITLQTFNNIPVTDLYSVLEQILALNNLTVVKSGNFYRFLPIKDAITKPLSIFYGDQSNVPQDDRLIIQIIPLKHVSVESMKKIISPLLTKNSTFLDVPETNNLMLVELSSNVKRIIKVIQALDIDKLSKSDIQLYRVEHADVGALAREINEVFGTLGYKEALGNTLNFFPLERLNSILVVNAFPDIQPTIEFWIEKLDQPISASGGKISTVVYNVQNGDADKLATLLNSIFVARMAPARLGIPARPGVPGIPGVSATPGAPGTPGVSTTPGTPGTPGVSATPSVPGTPGTPGTAGVSTGAFGTTGALGSPGTPGIQVKGGLTDEFEGPLTIIADKETNSLIIRTSPRNYPIILDLIKKLDLHPKQVLIEVLIMDLTLDEQTLTGFEWALKNTGKVTTSGGLTSAGSQLPGALSSSSTLLGSASGTSATSIASAIFTQGASFFVQRPERFVALIHAFARDSKANVIANPLIVTSNNKPANISITNEIPIVTTIATPSTSGSQLSQQVQYRSVGVKLQIDPKINKDRFVNLKITQEISSRGVDVGQQPSFNTRTVTSDVFLKDNQILVMGGLMQSTTTMSKEGIPFLKDLPYLGRVFGANSSSSNKTELMLFITPHIISSTDDVDFTTEQFKNRLSKFVPLRKQIEGAGDTETQQEKTSELKKPSRALKPEISADLEPLPEKAMEKLSEPEKHKEKPVEPAKSAPPVEKTAEPAKAEGKPVVNPAEPEKSAEKLADPNKTEEKSAETATKRTKSIKKRVKPAETTQPQ